MARREYTALGYTFSGDDNFRLPSITTHQIHDILKLEGFSTGVYLDDGLEFHWYDVEGVTSAFSMPVELSQVIHLRTVDQALAMLQENPECYVLVPSDSIDLPAQLKPYDGRVIVAVADEENDPLAMVQEIFLRMLRWENQLNFMAHANGALDDLLNVGSSMFDGFIFVAGVDNNVIGYSTKTSFPNEEYEHMIRDNKLVSSKMFVDAFLTDDFCALSGYVVEVRDDYGNTCVVTPVRYDGSLFGFVVLVCGERLEVTPGLKDQFKHFAAYAVDKCRRKLKVGVEKDIPHFYFLSALLRGDTFTRATIEQNLNRLGIPLKAHYKVVALSPRESRQGADILVDAMRCLNGKRSLVVLFEDYVVAILYEERVDGALSHRKTLEDLERFIYRPYGLVCGFSQVFDQISDVRLGFRQAVYALANRNAIDVERSMMKEDDILYGVSFEMALPYFLIKENDVDREFHEFCLSHSPLETLLNNDLENGTNNFLLLWLFLLYERNASLVGRRLYMHRNSVLYHIKQIEKRFDFNLDSWYAREKLLMDYRFLFLRLPDDVLERLFKKG